MLDFCEYKIENVSKEQLEIIIKYSNKIKEKRIDNYLVERKMKKIGRNEPCPCGSGKKYKKCCGLYK